MDRFIKKLEIMQQFARDLSALSLCKRAQTGCVIHDLKFQNMVISYNGPASRMPHNSCTGVEGDCTCRHAESNALDKLDFAIPAILHSTVCPCEYCALKILRRNIIAVTFDIVYRTNMGLQILNDKIYVKQIKEISNADISGWYNLSRESQ